MPISRPLRLCAALLALACGACSSSIVKEPVRTLKEMTQGEGAPELEAGLKSYEDGAYKIAAKQLQAALDQGLDAKGDQAKAHKYLAFIHCVSGREKSCREEFRKAFAADPRFQLEAAEAGHPLWAPVFRQVRAEAAAKEKAK